MLSNAFANTFSQPLAKKLGTIPTLFLRGITVCLILGVISIPSLYRLANIHYALFALLLGVAGYFPAQAFTHGVKVSRVGIIAPIAGCSTLVTVLLAATFLHAPIEPLQWAAIILVLIANIGVSVNIKSLRESSFLQLASGIPFAFMTAIGWGLFFFALVYPTRHIGPWLSAFLVELGLTLTAGVHLLISKQGVPIKHAFSKPVMMNGICIATGTAAFVFGVSRYNAGIVASLNTATALPSVLLAAYYFKERLSRVEIVAAATMIVGVVLVSAP